MKLEEKFGNRGFPFILKVLVILMDGKSVFELFVQQKTLKHGFVISPDP